MAGINSSRFPPSEKYVALDKSLTHFLRSTTKLFVVSSHADYEMVQLRNSMGMAKVSYLSF